MTFSDWVIELTTNHYINVSFTLWLFWLGFVVYAALHPAMRARKWFVFAPGIPLMLHALIVDVLLSQTVGRLMFWELAGTLTLSQRLDNHYDDDGWRGRLARECAWYINWIFDAHITGKKGGA